MKKQEIGRWAFGNWSTNKIRVYINFFKKVSGNWAENEQHIICFTKNKIRPNLSPLLGF